MADSRNYDWKVENPVADAEKVPYLYHLNLTQSWGREVQ